jgi:hypothetical protein
VSLDPGMHFGRPSSTAVRRLRASNHSTTHHQYPRTPSPLPAPLQHNCASHYPANEPTTHELFRIYHRTLQPPATAQSRFTLQLPSPYHQNRSPVRSPLLFNSRSTRACFITLPKHTKPKIRCILAVACYRANHHRKESNRGEKPGRHGRLKNPVGSAL